MAKDDRSPAVSPDDSSFHSLFTHPRMIQDLCLGFLREPWAGRLDFSTLEATLAGGLAGEAGSGIVWRLRFLGGRTWIHLVLALAPEVDRTLPLRLAGGIAALLLDLHRQGRLARSGRLPGVVPLILYHGEPLWSVPRQLADLFEPVPNGLERALPRLAPQVLDVRREPIPERLTSPGVPGVPYGGNLAALLFALERSRTWTDLDRGVAHLAEILPGPLTGPLADLRRDFARYLRDWLLPHRFAGSGFSALLTPGLDEVSPLLREALAAMPDGGHPLREQGRRQGAAELLARLLDHRFGPLDATDRSRLAGAAIERLHAWGERALSAPTLDEVFD
jgi:hypothetical protein